MALKKVGNMGSGSIDTRDLGMTDSSWGDPEGLNLMWGTRLGHIQMGNPRDKVIKGSFRSLMKSNDL